MGGGASSVAPEDHVPHQDDVNKCQQRGPGKRRSRGCCGCFSMERRYSVEDPERETLREEAKTWSTNFERLLRHPVGCKVFQEFLQSQFSDENLRFWIEAEKYAKMSAEERKTRAKTLYDDYVSTISPCEISLDAQHRTKIENNLQASQVDLFKQAQDYIFCLMYRDCFPRFLKSKVYRRLCR